MPDTVSDKDVERTRARVEKLREQVAEEKAKASVVADEGANAVRVASLERDEEALKAELATLKEANKPRAQREAVADAIEGPEEIEPADDPVAPDNIEVK
jgi:hypothetical protein